MIKQRTIIQFVNVILLTFSTSFTTALANQPIVYETSHFLKKINPPLLYEDTTSQLNLNDVLKINSFSYHDKYPLNLGLSNSTFWIKFQIKNNTNDDKLILSCSYPIIDEIELYTQKNNGVYDKVKLGDNYPFSNRKYNHQYFLFNINIKKGSTQEFILKVKSWEQLNIPLFVGTPQLVYESVLTHDLIFGIFFGIMLVLVLYNLFLFFTTKDINYLFYVIYIFFITLTQAALNGYSFKFIFPDYPYISNISLIIFNSLAGLAAIKFIQSFLKVKFHLPKLNKGYIIITIIYISGIVSVLLNIKQTSFKLMDLGGFLIAFYSLLIAIIISLKGKRYAKIFLSAWFVFLVGVILFVLKNTGILPSTPFTNYTMTIGIAIEGIILSIALADRINALRKEKETSQKLAYETLEKNEQLILEQNIILEKRVEERTIELNKTLADLKETQSQLVDAEKMSSLGQLTAGIAHEINNPINFVSSNITPLKQDINDLNTIIKKYEEINADSDIVKKLNEINALKEELDFEFLKTELHTIIKGIENGANRTSEIVRGLRNFSRLDESDLILADINEGLESTLIILKSSASGITINTKFSTIPQIACYPGKLNQVFLNIINNAIQATKENANHKGEIEITTKHEKETIIITISDNGIGMTDAIKAKIFEPFFTTKDVGKGTGLGLSITYRIIKNHNGKIEVNSTPNKGTTFTITLPINQQIK